MSEEHHQQTQSPLSDQTGTIQPAEAATGDPEPAYNTGQQSEATLKCEPGTIAGVSTHEYTDKGRAPSGEALVDSAPKTIIGFFTEIEQMALDEAEKLGQTSPSLLSGDLVHGEPEAIFRFLENRVRILEQRVQWLLDTQHHGVLM